MRKITFILATLALLSTMSVSAQTKSTTDQRVNALESKVQALENEKKTMQSEISSLLTDVAQLKDRYAHYQKQLDLRQVHQLTVNNIEYGVVGATGDKKTNTVVVNLYGLNKDTETRTLQFANISFNDFDGNIFKVADFEDVSIGGQSIREDFQPNINNKIAITFKNIPVGTRISNLHIEEIASLNES